MIEKIVKECKNLHETANVASIWAGNQHGDLFFKVLFKNNHPGAQKYHILTKNDNFYQKKYKKKIAKICWSFYRGFLAFFEK